MPAKPKKSGAPRACVDGVPVWCSHDEIVAVADLKPHPQNPNQHPPNQIKALARVIAGTGWRQPITVSLRSGFIIKGHGRLEAAQEMESSAVPVCFQHYDSAESEFADLIADNRLAEIADMDRAALRDLLESLDDGNFDMSLTGYDAESLEDFMTPEQPPEPGAGGGAESFQLVIDFESQFDQREALERLRAEGFNVSILDF